MNSAAIKDTRGDGDTKMLLLQCIPLIRVHLFQQQKVLLPNSPSRRSLNSDRSVRRFYSAVNVNNSRARGGPSSAVHLAEGCCELRGLSVKE